MARAKFYITHIHIFCAVVSVLICIDNLKVTLVIVSWKKKDFNDEETSFEVI